MTSTGVSPRESVFTIAGILRLAELVMAMVLCASFLCPTAEAQSRKVLEVAPPGDYFAEQAAALGITMDVAEDVTAITQEALAQHDTVLISNDCLLGRTDPNRSKEAQLTEDQKRRLVDWVSAGHKLLLFDADTCTEGNKPDYSFLGYKLETVNPGALGAVSDKMAILENSSLASWDFHDPAHFVNFHHWLTTGNQLGDASIIKNAAPQWCGLVFGVNALSANGFGEAYLHLGKGLVVYAGFDIDDVNVDEFVKILALELKQPVNPDGLKCTVPVTTGFVILVPAHYAEQELIAGDTALFPVGVYSNQDYRGVVHLAVASVSPSHPGITTAFSVNAVTLGASGETKLSVRTTAAVPAQEYVLTIAGSDAAGTKASAQVRLRVKPPNAPKVIPGRIKVWGDPEALQSSTPIEFIIDYSGSMKEKIEGPASKIDIARKVMRDVLAKLPDDSTVGLRVYGNHVRSGPKACSDMELAVPVDTLDRNKMTQVIDTLTPLGETPLVASILKTPEDLGNTEATVVLVTDGEESCGGNVKTVPQGLKASGRNLRLFVIGFGVTNPKVQQQMRDMTRPTGGSFLPAKDSASLAAALLYATAQSATFTILDEGDQDVVSGQLGQEVPVPPGSYGVEVLVGENLLRVEKVRVTSGRTSEAKVIKTDAGPVLQSPDAPKSADE
ncbi:MAG: VWA domain-containing protein [Terriglobia bacterium]